MKALLRSLAAVAVVVGACAVPAYGVPTITVTDGLGNSVTIADNGSGDFNSAAGVETFVGSVGAWKLNVFTGVTMPFLGSATSPSMDLSFLASGGVGTLTVTFSGDNFGPTSDGAAASIGGTSSGTVSYKTVANNGTTLTDQGPFSGAFSGTQSGMSLAGFGVPFSLSQVISITHTSSSQLSSGDATLATSVPDGGATFMLLGGAVAGLGLVRRKLNS